MNEYLQQAQDFLAKTNATMQIDFVGFASNTNWKESTPRAMYQFKLTTPKGSMTDTFLGFYQQYSHPAGDDSILC